MKLIVWPRSERHAAGFNVRRHLLNGHQDHGLQWAGFALSSIRARSPRTFNRVFIDGDTVTAVCATDGDVYFTRKLDDVGISGVVVGIVRKLEPEERKDGSAWEAFCKEILPGESAS